MRLLHPPRGERWWRDEGGLHVLAAGTVWTLRDGVVTSAAHVDEPLVRVAGDTVLRWRGRWRATFPLPDGAADAPTLQPFPGGVAWLADGFAYVLHGKVRVVGETRATALAAGPGGAVLLGHDDLWTHAAPASGRIRPLPVPLARTPWGERWTDEAVAGLDADGHAVRVDLTTLAYHVTRDALPLDAAGHHLHADGRLDAVTPGWRAREASCHREGALLAGPGAVVWDLVAGVALFTAPVVRLGATAATAAGWWTADWQTGDGVWFDPRTGAVTGTFRVPLAPGDVVTAGHGDVAFTAMGDAFRVDDGAPVEAEPPEEPDPTAVIGGVRYTWSDDGLLVADP